MNNVTAANNAGSGFDASGSGVSLFNSISFANGTNTITATSTGNNLAGVNPNFTDAAARNYQLQNPSPAIDTGLNSAPGGVGTGDVAGNPRIVNAIVDKGAYENATGVVSAFDPNNDGSINVLDAFYLVNFLFASGSAPIGAGDANGDALVTPADVVYLLNYLFRGGTAPA